MTGSETHRRRGGRSVVVLVVAAVSAAVVAIPAAAQEGEPRADIVVNQIPGTLDMSAAGVGFTPGDPVRITFSGGGGDSREFSRRVGDDTDDASFVWAPSRLDPCRLGASDLPGTQFRVTVDVPSAPYSLDQLVNLDPDTTKPRFLAPPFDASPRPGSKVEVGDEIDFEVTATDKTPARSWQTGVHSLEVTGPEGLAGPPKDGGRQPKACGEKSKSLTMRGSHPVKRSDPAVIELCATAEDYVPNTNTKCARWYKGEVWQGTFTGTNTGTDSAGTTCTGEDNGAVTLAVDDNDEVTGTLEVSGSETCTTADGITVTVPTSGGVGFNGTFEDGEFRLGVDELTGFSYGPVCIGTILELPVERGAGSAEGAYPYAGGEYVCSITVERQRGDDSVG